MQHISEVMSRNPASITPRDSVLHAAQLMEQLDVGALPVCDGDRLVGMVTDRDITIRVTAAGRAPDAACVADALSKRELCWCTEEQSVDEVLGRMGEAQIRRLPVVDREQRLVGIVSLGDLSCTQSGDVQQALSDISQSDQASSRGGQKAQPDYQPPAQQAGHEPPSQQPGDPQMGQPQTARSEDAEQRGSTSDNRDPLEAGSAAPGEQPDRNKPGDFDPEHIGQPDSPRTETFSEPGQSAEAGLRHREKSGNRAENE